MADEELPSYTPQAVTDLLPIYHPDPSTSNLYTLHQTSSTTQTLSSDTYPAETLQIKTSATGGFLNKRPHIIVTRPLLPTVDGAPAAPPTPSPPRRLALFRRSPSPPSSATRTKLPPTLSVAEARFDVHGTGTSINYLSPPISSSSDDPATIATNNHPPAYPPAYPGPSYPPPATYHVSQRLELESSTLQSLATTIDGRRHYWAPHPGNKNVLELTNEADDILARFVHSHAAATGLGGGRNNSVVSHSSMGVGMDSITRVATGSSVGTIREGSGTGECGRNAGRRGSSKDAWTSYEIGTLELVPSLIPTEQAREEVLVSAVVIVERAKRRSANLGLCGSKKGSASGGATVGSWSGPVGVRG